MHSGQLNIAKTPKSRDTNAREGLEIVPIKNLGGCYIAIGHQWNVPEEDVCVKSLLAERKQL